MENILDRPLKILLVEDDAVDVMMFRKTLADVDVPNEIKLCRCAGCAKKALVEGDIYPDVIFLDEVLPESSGSEFKEWLDSSKFKNIRVIRLTGSPESIKDPGDSVLLVKPPTVRTMSTVLQLVGAIQRVAQAAASYAIVSQGIH